MNILRIGITGLAGSMGTHLFNRLNLEPELFGLIHFEDSYFQNMEVLNNWVKKCDVVVHLAALNRHNPPTHGEELKINVDGLLKLIYINELSEVFRACIDEKRENQAYKVLHTSEYKVSEILTILEGLNFNYLEQGMVPRMESDFERNLFNTFRSYIDIPRHYPVPLQSDCDDRESYVETMRLGIGGQVSFSTTHPVITGENHFHSRKIERIVVFKGEAMIKLHKIGTEEVIEYYVTVKDPCFADMLIWYTHNITNVGKEDLYTQLMALLDEHVNHIIAHTGQNYDELIEIFCNDPGLRKPDFFLDVNVSSLEASVGDIIRKSGELLRKQLPDAMLVLGDTNSCLSAYMAKRLQIPIFHMEPGNCSFDFNVPEEINRRVIDHLADYNLVYTEHARGHLISEGLPHRRMYLTGSPMKEGLDFYLSKIISLTILKELMLQEKNYFIVSVHPEENADNPENLEKIMVVLDKLSTEYQVPVIESTHPRSRNRLEAEKNKKTGKDIHFLNPFGFTDYVHLQMHAMRSISDGGTISEESAILSFPAISLSKSLECSEANPWECRFKQSLGWNYQIQQIA